MAEQYDCHLKSVQDLSEYIHTCHSKNALHKQVFRINVIKISFELSPVVESKGLGPVKLFERGREKHAPKHTHADPVPADIFAEDT